MNPLTVRIILLISAMSPTVAQSVDDRTYSEIERPFNWNDERIEFVFEPSFRDGFVIWLFPREGKAQLRAQKLHRKASDSASFHSLTPAAELANVEISAREFDAIVSAFERRELQQQSERTRIGLDGSSWTFRRQIGGRLVVLRFWTPAADSEAGRLGAELARAARLDPKLLHGK
jgi:hypothetical protein